MQIPSRLQIKFCIIIIILLLVFCQTIWFLCNTSEQLQLTKYKLFTFPEIKNNVKISLSESVLKINGSATKDNRINTKSGEALADIKIASVICEKPENVLTKTEASVMLKSVIISAMLYGVKSLQFHLFVENVDLDETFFRDKLKEYGYPYEDIKVILQVHSAIEIVPYEYREEMIEKPEHRCGYARAFIPEFLLHVDSIMYLDTDVIFTGNLEQIWSLFGKMRGEQLIGIAQDLEPDSPVDVENSLGFFGEIPYPYTKGLNSGVLLMNLTRMREYRWQEKFLRLFTDYYKLLTMTSDQRILNILLYFDAGLRMKIPCQFNFRHAHCNQGLYCDGAKEDSYGIHVIHGTRDTFHEQGQNIFRKLFHIYQQVNMTVPNLDLKQQLIYPVLEANTANNMSWCEGHISGLLFKTFINSL